MKATVATKPGHPFEHITVIEKPIPQPGANQVQVKVHAAATNPVDWKMAASGFATSEWPSGLGADSSGVVSAVGAGVTRFKVGDAVFGFTALGVPGHTAYAEYLVEDQEWFTSKPASMSHDQASTYGVGALTAAVAFYHHMSMPIPSKATPTNQHVLIWGGSSSVGLFAVQLARLSGFQVIATCSPRNFDLVKKLGAHHVVDARSATAVADIKAIAPSLHYALDCIGAETAASCIAALSTDGKAQLSTISGSVDNVPAHVKHYGVFVGGAANNPTMKAFLLSFIPTEFHALVHGGKLLPNPVQVVEGGLSGVKKALELSSSGKVSASKLVIHVV